MAKICECHRLIYVDRGFVCVYCGARWATAFRWA